MLIAAMDMAAKPAKSLEEPSDSYPLLHLKATYLVSSGFAWSSVEQTSSPFSGADSSISALPQQAVAPQEPGSCPDPIPQASPAAALTRATMAAKSVAFIFVSTN